MLDLPVVEVGQQFAHADTAFAQVWVVRIPLATNLFDDKL